jgi:16S rRNA processing protein RimM
VRVRPLTDRPAQRFGGLVDCIVWDRAADRWERRRVRSSRLDGDGVILALEDVDSPEAAAALIGRLIAVGSDEVLPAPAGHFYPWQLEGATVVTTQGRVVGSFAGVEPGPAHDLWVIRTDGREWLLPAVPEIVVEVSTAEGRIVVDPPDGLADL